MRETTNIAQWLNQQSVENLFIAAYSEAAQQLRSAVLLIQGDEASPNPHNNQQMQGEEPRELLSSSLVVIPSHSVIHQQLIHPNSRSSNSAPARMMEEWENSSFRMFAKALCFYQLTGSAPPMSAVAQSMEQDHEGSNAFPHVHQDAITTATANSRHAATMTAVLLYNYGLSYHLRGLGESSSAPLPNHAQEFVYRRSLDLYQVAYQTIMNLAAKPAGEGRGGDNREPEGQHGGTQGRGRKEGQDAGAFCSTTSTTTFNNVVSQEGNRLLLMSLCNNMAHIHLHFGETEQVEMCLDLLRNALLVGTAASEDAHFVLNLFVYSSRPRNPAPSA